MIQDSRSDDRVPHKKFTQGNLNYWMAPTWGGLQNDEFFVPEVSLLRVLSQRQACLS
jgi:hypothetical protein